MKIVKSKLLGEEIVIAENKDEYDEALAVAKERNATLYTAREIEYIGEIVADMSPDEKRNNLITVNKIKKMFDGFYVIPSDWKPKK